VTGLKAGETYTSTEVDLPAGFSLASIVCDDDNSEGDVATRKATITLDDDEVVKCVFTNRLQTTPTPTETAAATASPTPTPTPPPGPVVLPTAITPKPTATPGSPTVAPATPVAPPPSGSGGSSGTMDWSRTALSLICAALLTLAGARLAVQSIKRRTS
jgi:hypothetical protein